MIDPKVVAFVGLVTLVVLANGLLTKDEEARSNLVTALFLIALPCIIVVGATL